jgi:multidrug efflux pump
MLSRIFIDRPIFAWVIAIIVMMCGIGAIFGLPVAQYPDVAPPQVTVRATYPGASAEAVQNSVTQVIEQSLSGIDGLLYFSSSSNSRGQVTITVTFQKGTNPDIAQVQVQNQVQQAVARLPQQVQQQGLIVRKTNPDPLLLVGVYDKNDRLSKEDIADYLNSNLVDPLSRLKGVGSTDVFGTAYAMRIWLDPRKLVSFQLVPGDVIDAIRSQNTEIAAGEIGGLPAPANQYLNVSVTAQSRLQTPEQFAEIVLKTNSDGASVRMKDVSRIELGAETYGNVTRVNGHPGAGMSISLAPGADALSTAELVKAELKRQSAEFPPGMTYAYGSDTTDFIKLSIHEVVVTLVEAIILVIIVMFIFLQSWRATLIPTIAVPVVLLGTLGIFYVAGLSINTLTLFGMVLAIGLLVDDAIVVVENVERLLHENPDMTPREATIESMREISIALIAIALVLSAVFLPMAFFGGSTGVIYRQFSVTIISAMSLSVLVALILSPALTAALLRQSHDEPEESFIERRLPALAGLMERAKNGFNTRFEDLANRYQGAISNVVDRKKRFLAIYVLIFALLAVLFIRLPTGFLPTEDQGIAAVSFQLPAGATLNRAEAVRRTIEHYFQQYEAKNVATLFTIAGGGGGRAGQNVGQGYIGLAPWDQRRGTENGADAITQRATKALSALRDAQIFAVVPPAIRGLGQSNGFTVELQNVSGMSHDKFVAATNDLIAEARQDPMLAAVRLTELPDISTLKVNIDNQKLAALGLTQSDVNTTLATAWGGTYVNDFVDRGRVKKVYVQGDAPFRHAPEDLSSWYVRGANSQMAPFSSFARIGWAQAPTALSRFNGIPSFEISGQAAPGHSSGAALKRIQELAAQIPGTNVALSGLSYQEALSANEAPMLYALSLLVVFLCLAALYESWSIPIAVLLIVPLGLVGAVLAVTLRGLVNDVYLQIGLLTTMGLAAKNAILMIEFAEQAEKQGKRIIEAAIEAARIRLRPILMTSFAFIFGVLPLALSTGAGANSRIAIGTAVIGGMLTATLLAIFYIPLFFVIVRRTTRDTLARLHHHPHGDQTPPAPEGTQP